MVTAEARQETPAQKHKTPDEWVSELDAVVTLTADQKVKAKALAEQTEAKAKALRAEATATREALKEKRMALRKEQKEALANILNVEQEAKWKAHQAAKRPDQGAPKKHRTPDEIVADLDGIVGLSADQKTKIKTLAETKASKMKALEAQTNLSEESIKEKKRDIGNEYHDGVNAVLTAEQKAKLKAHREANRPSYPARSSAQPDNQKQ